MCEEVPKAFNELVKEHADGASRNLPSTERESQFLCAMYRFGGGALSSMGHSWEGAGSAASGS